MAPVSTQMLKSNWFDTEFATSLATATAEQALVAVANSPRLIQELKTALASHDTTKISSGPSRTQVIRETISKVLMSDT